MMSRGLILPRRLYLSSHLDTTKHKALVFWFMLKVCLALLKRAVTHDLSKYSTVEAESFGRWQSMTRHLTYGTEEYRRAAASFARDNRIHTSVNKHHPEYWPGGIADMSPLDRLEMLCDWKAKTATRQGVDIIKSIEINSRTFNYNEQLQKGFIRDINEAGFN